MADIFDLSSLFRSDRNVDRLVDLTPGAAEEAPKGSEPGSNEAEFLDKMLSGTLTGEGSADDLPAADPALDWSNQELADLYRVQHLLSQAGVPIGTDRGTTDEGDPWFVFLDARGEVFVHLARVDGLYLLDSSVQEGVLYGPCFRSLIDGFSGKAEAALAVGRPDSATIVALRKRGKIVMHPGAALAALIWTIYLENDELALLDGAAASAAAPQTDPNLQTPADGETPEAAPSPEFAALFADAQEAAEFIADAKAARDAALRAPTADAAISHATLALTNPLGATALGLSALAVAFGLTLESQNERDAQVASVSEIDRLIDEDDGAIRVHETSVAERDETKAVALAANLMVPEAHSAEDADAGQRATEQPEEIEASTLIAAQPASALVPAVVASPQVAVTAEPADAAVTNAVTLTATATIAQDDLFEENADTQMAERGSLSRDISLLRESSRGDLADLIDLIGTQDAANAEISLLSVETRSANVPESLFDLLDQTLWSEMTNALAENAPIAVSIGVDSPSAGAAELPYDLFDEDARLFVSHLVQSSDVDVYAFMNEVVVVDRRALEAGGEDAFARSWSYENGAVISMVGIKADFEAFDMIA